MLHNMLAWAPATNTFNELVALAKDKQGWKQFRDGVSPADDEAWRRLQQEYDAVEAAKSVANEALGPGEAPVS